MKSVRMRYITQAVTELHQLDPNTPVNARLIKRLVKQGIIPSVPVGNGNRRLINFDALLEYLENPQPPATDANNNTVHSIRRIEERK